MTRWRRKFLTAALGVLAATCLAIGAIIVRVGVEARRPLRGGAEYVALGSSFASGPGVARRASGSPTLCMRSAGNYAQLFAARRGLDLTDATCAGATVRHVLEGGQYLLRPQIDALRPHTRLVTVTVGGNDVAYLTNLSAWSCRRARSVVPLIWRRTACGGAGDQEVERAFAELPSQLERLVQEVRARAPSALVVVVDYVTILPDGGPCVERMPLAPSELARGRVVAARLARVTEEVARRTEVLLVRASEATRGHDVCAAEPWVFEYTFPATPFAFGPLFYHPNESAMAAVADALDRAVPAALPSRAESHVRGEAHAGPSRGK